MGQNISLGNKEKKIMLNIGIFTSLRDKEAYDLLYGLLKAVDSGYLSGVNIKVCLLRPA